jgi:hypothetical protein
MRKKQSKNSITIKGKEDLCLPFAAIPMGSGNLNRQSNIISVNYCIRRDMKNTVLHPLHA